MWRFLLFVSPKAGEKWDFPIEKRRFCLKNMASMKKSYIFALSALRFGRPGQDSASGFPEAVY